MIFATQSPLFLGARSQILDILREHNFLGLWVPQLCLQTLHLVLPFARFCWKRQCWVYWLRLPLGSSGFPPGGEIVEALQCLFGPACVHPRALSSYLCCAFLLLARLSVDSDLEEEGLEERFFFFFFALSFLGFFPSSTRTTTSVGCR